MRSLFAGYETENSIFQFASGLVPLVAPFL
jgi:hypothetical protein